MTQTCSCGDYSEFLSKLQVFRREANEANEPLGAQGVRFSVIPMTAGPSCLLPVAFMPRRNKPQCSPFTMVCEGVEGEGFTVHLVCDIMFQRIQSENDGAPGQYFFVLPARGIRR
jgi:hypothetical protein